MKKNEKEKKELFWAINNMISARVAAGTTGSKTVATVHSIWRRQREAEKKLLAIIDKIKFEDA